MRTHLATKVILNVYDLSEHNEYLYQFGFGLFHSGIQLNGLEYAFASGGGVQEVAPKYAPGAIFRESLQLGTFHGTSQELQTVLDRLRSSFRGEDYDLLGKNCNSFAEALTEQLLGEGRFPGWVNRAAWVGSFFSCLLPKDSTGQAPVGHSGGPSSSSRSSSGYQVHTPYSRRIAAASSDRGGSGSRPSTHTHSFSGAGFKLGSAQSESGAVALGSNRASGDARQSGREAQSLPLLAVSPQTQTQTQAAENKRERAMAAAARRSSQRFG
jgi:hypothetical protein